LRKLLKEELHGKMRWGETCVVHGDMAYKIVVRKPGGKISLERPKRRWENSMKIYLRHK
jgi:hypothetical protein